MNVGAEQTVQIIETDCEYTTNERHVTQEARWNGTKFVSVQLGNHGNQVGNYGNQLGNHSNQQYIYGNRLGNHGNHYILQIDDLKVEHPGKTYLKQVATQIVWDKEDSWDNCVNNTQVKPIYPSLSPSLPYSSSIEATY